MKSTGKGACILPHCVLFRVNAEADNQRSGNIRLNTKLAKKPPGCLEYVVVHEMAHLLEPSHNSRFTALMDGFMPSWRNHREDLNRSPLGHKEWDV
jgi:predicted metal-dependent hydrolase